MARVDSLPEGAKKVLQTGSVIEREFSYELIKSVTGLSKKDLLFTLSVLKDSELIFERGIFPESTYIFKHALTREVVYDSILTRRKKKLHEAIGEAIEDIYKDNIDEHCIALAEHFIEGESYEKGGNYSRLAAKKARKESAYSDAISYANKEVYCIEKMPKTDAVQKKIIDARTNLANYCFNLNFHIEAKEIVDAVADLALELNYKKKLPIIYNVIGSYTFYVEENFSKAFEYLDNAAKIAADTGDYLSLWNANYFLGSGLSLNCEFKKGLDNFQKSLDLAVAAGNSVGISIAKSTICSMNYIPRGEIDLAFRESKDSLRIAEESGDKRTMGIAHFNYGYCLYCKGLFDEAENNLLKGISFCEKLTHYIWAATASMMLGNTYVYMKKYEIAKNYYDKGISFFELSKGFLSYILFNKVAKARVDILSKAQDVDISELFDFYNNNKIKWIEGWMAMFISEILLNLDDQRASQAEHWITKAIEVDTRYGLMWNLGRDYALYAELFKRKGDQSKAKENLGKAIDIFKECGADGWVEKYEKELATLS
jgi:tetratricopeptide (TPR) repeat protein